MGVRRGSNLSRIISIAPNLHGKQCDDTSDAEETVEPSNRRVIVKKFVKRFENGRKVRPPLDAHAQQVLQLTHGDRDGSGGCESGNDWRRDKVDQKSWNQTSNQEPHQSVPKKFELCFTGMARVADPILFSLFSNFIHIKTFIKNVMSQFNIKKRKNSLFVKTFLQV